MRKTRPGEPPLFRAPMLALALTALIATPAMPQTLVEKRLAALQPCSSLKLTQKIMGRPVTLAIDKLIDVTLSRATVTMAGDDVTLVLGTCNTFLQTTVPGSGDM